MHAALNNLFQPDSRAQSLLRNIIVLMTIGVILASGRALVMEIRAPAAIKTASAPERPVARQPSAQEDALRIGQAHLFGSAQAAQSALPVQTVADVTLSGVLFSDRQEDSYAILVVGGQTAVVVAGAKLPDGETLHAVAEDGVILERNGTLVRVPLDIKKADSNARTPLLALGGGAAGEASGPAIAPMSEPDSPEQPKASWNSQQGMGQGMMTHGTFMPLSSIRGNQAKLRLATPGTRPPGGPR